MDKCSNEILGLIFEELFLDETATSKDLANCALVSKRFNAAADPFLYRGLRLRVDEAVESELDKSPDTTLKPETLELFARMKRMIPEFHKRANVVHGIEYSRGAAKHLDLGPPERFFADHVLPFNKIRRLALYTAWAGASYKGCTWIEIIKGISHVVVSNPHLEQILVMHKPEPKDYSEDFDLGPVREILEKGSVARVRHVCIEFMLGNYDEPEEDTWTLTEHMMTVLEGSSGSISRLLLDYTVRSGGSSAEQSQKAPRKLWNLPNLQELRVHFLGKTTAPLTEMFNLETLSKVDKFYFQSFVCQYFDEVVENFSSLLNVREVTVIILKINHWVQHLTMPVFSRIHGMIGCYNATAALARVLRRLERTHFNTEQNDGHVAIMDYTIARSLRLGIVPRVDVVQTFGHVTEQRYPYLMVGHHVP
ncbi:hypothetical protein TWF481_000144 [Arthrobotrys musiformis]|uniref:F-box domain-containing protein n=1 Tax=Arthrobotrys musiformis TaxID=47236 RepID=A0AAV9WM25_9PEZI